MNYFWHGADVDVEPIGETALVCISNERTGVNVTGNDRERGDQTRRDERHEAGPDP